MQRKRLYSGNMFDPQELKQLKELFIEAEQRITDELRSEISESEKRMVSKIHNEISESEKRTVFKIHNEISESEKRVSSKVDHLSTDLGGFIDMSLLPQIAEKADEKEVKKLAEKTLAHESIFKKLKAAFVS